MILSGLDPFKTQECSKRKGEDSVDEGAQKKAKLSPEEDEETPWISAGCTLSAIEQYVDSHSEELLQNLQARLEKGMFDQLRERLAQKTLKMFQFKSDHVYNKIENIYECIPEAGNIKLTVPLRDYIVNLLFQKTGNRALHSTNAHGQQCSKLSDEKNSTRSIHAIGNPDTTGPAGDEEDGATPKETSSSLDSGFVGNSQTEVTASVEYVSPCLHPSVQDKVLEPEITEPHSPIVDSGEEMMRPPTRFTSRSPQQPPRQKNTKMTMKVRRLEAIEQWIDHKVKDLESRNPGRSRNDLKESLCRSLNIINRREHERFRCLLTEDTMTYTDPTDNSSAILKIVLPKKAMPEKEGNLKKASDFGPFYNSTGFSKNAKFSLQFDMGVIGSVSKTDVYFYGAEDPLVTAEYKVERFKLFTACFKRCAIELLVPVIALYKDIQRKARFSRSQDYQ